MTIATILTLATNVPLRKLDALIPALSKPKIARPAKNRLISKNSEQVY